MADLDAWHMRRALELASLGRGAVEPNPLVGCVVAAGAEIIGQGYHRRFGGPHAEVEALAVAGARARGATVYVTLEPCCHFGKTPPCSRALIAAGVRRVVIAMADPFPAVAGQGMAELRTAGIDVTCGLLEAEARELNAPYLKLLATGQPWVIAKWAMTLDGRIASRTGHSQWISNPRSRQVAHDLRRRVDAVVVGLGTVRSDDPMLTARPAGPRVATRIVLDTNAQTPVASQLVHTADAAPVLIVCTERAPAENRSRLQASGCELLVLPEVSRAALWPLLLEQLGRRRMTNILVEGGAQVLGSAWDAQIVDEVHAFIAPRLIGGAAAPGPIAGQGLGTMLEARSLRRVVVESLDGDIHLHGLVERGTSKHGTDDDGTVNDAPEAIQKSSGDSAGP